MRNFKRKWVPRYTPDDLREIGERVRQIQERFPHFSERRARIWEVVSRSQGENGLSEQRVEYLTGCVEAALDNMKETDVNGA